ncbi:rhomboid family intramembrane serine protease [Actinomadura sp. ATCC 31491]|uniref:Rhomboid family intramembrane serine protease n=1 Tax=Actinomadura luzonensis TaxID=2805427 RepID=A0ABT0FKF6_9ACTN|nr:rhomboid family intramembrane serine protease [Actinomadura luzonensis]MCK2212810.1 rhomboid family intramembrane serine protease [Actinomadura luzonensis]
MPYLTAVVLAITAVPSLLQFVIPGLEPAWARDPAAIAAHGQWWRLATALLVQDGGPFGTLVNLGFLAVLGHLAERALGRPRWLVLYAAGAVAGETAGYLLNQPGAGNSIALCALAAGLAVSSAGRLERSVGAFYAIVSGAWLLADLGVWGVVAMVALAAAGAQLVAHRARVPEWLFPAVPAVAAVALTGVPDLHGPALLSGLIVGWLWELPSREPPEPVADGVAASG